MTGPGVFSYSTTPANNVQANTGINWDEGMSPAAVNNSARQNMTDMRNAFNDLIWFKYGKGDLDYSPVYASGTTFTIAGADVRTAYHVTRRVKAVGSSTGTIYGFISAVAFSTNTTVTVVWDSGSLLNETLTIYLSQVPATGNPLPTSPIFVGTRATSTQSLTSGTTTKVQLNTTRIDNASYWDGTNYYYKPLVAGTYEVSGSVYVSGTTITGLVASISKNGTSGSGGTEVCEVTTVGLATAANQGIALPASYVTMNGSTDTLELDVTATGTGMITANAVRSTTQMSIRWVGP